MKKLDKAKELFIINYSNYIIHDQKFLIRIVEVISDQIVTIYALKSNFKEIDLTYLTKLNAWMNKFAIVENKMS